MLEMSEITPHNYVIFCGFDVDYLVLKKDIKSNRIE